jgi:hypothetical protein
MVVCQVPVSCYTGGMEEEVRWTLRLPRHLRDRLRECAERDHRSLNGQFVAVIEDYVRREDERRKEDAQRS